MSILGLCAQKSSMRPVNILFLSANCKVITASVILKLPPFSLMTPYCNRKMSSMEKFQISDRLRGTEHNVWVDVSKLAVEYKTLNLGQGFPDFMAPESIVGFLKEVANSENPCNHQYTRSFGHPRLVNVLAKLYEPYLKHPVNPATDILVTVGAYGALYSILQGLLNPGDEVIIIEPFFDCYQPMVKVAGAIPVFTALKPVTKNKNVTSSCDWKLDPQDLASKFNNKTKLIILNTPNNPLGKVFTLNELTLVADLCQQHNVVCIADEVYEWMTYDNSQHIKIASLPGMWERTVTIGSAGKTFSVTGWKIGWCVGPQHLVHSAQMVHQNCVNSCPTPNQEAIARGFELEMSRLERPDCYLTDLSRQLQPKRDKLARILARTGFKPIVPEAGYFMLAEFSNLNADVPKGEETKDFRFMKWLSVNKKLTVIPPSVFYCDDHKSLAENYVRFCFIKEDSTLQNLEDILKEWRWHDE